MRAPQPSRAITAAVLGAVVCAQSGLRPVAGQCESERSERNCGALGWPETFGVEDVCGQSQIQGQCRDASGFARALRACRGVGARLCTLDELDRDEARGTGCGFDGALAWTNTRGRLRGRRAAQAEGSRGVLNPLAASRDSLRELLCYTEFP